MDWQQADRGDYRYRWFGEPGWPPRPHAGSKVAVWRSRPSDWFRREEQGLLRGLPARTRLPLVRAGYDTREEVASLAGGVLGGGYGLLGVRNLGAKGRQEVLAWLGPPPPPLPLPSWVAEE